MRAWGTTKICCIASGGDQLLVTSLSGDVMHLQQGTLLDIVKMCSGPEGCSVAVVLQCIAKGGLQVMLHFQHLIHAFCCLHTIFLQMQGYVQHTVPQPITHTLILVSGSSQRHLTSDIHSCFVTQVCLVHSRQQRWVASWTIVVSTLNLRL